MRTRIGGILRAALAAVFCALACAACVQGGAVGDSSAVPTGNMTAYGTIDEGIVIKR